MVEEESMSSSGGIKLADIYFVLFRHKWKIIFITLLGLVAAAGLYAYYPRIYVSEAKVLVRYIVERKTVNAADTGGGDVRMPDITGASIMNSEMEILTSFDLAYEVASVIGPDRILGSESEATATNKAAVALSKALRVVAPSHSKIILVQFRHTDPSLVQLVLSKLLTLYEEKHVEVHRETGVLNARLRQEADSARRLISDTEQEIQNIRDEMGMFSVEETQKIYQKQLDTLLADLLATEAELEQRKAAMSQAVPTPAPPPDPSSGAVTEEPALEPAADLPEESVREYVSARKRLEEFTKQRQDLLFEYTEEYFDVKRVTARIEETRKLLESMEAMHPELTTITIPAPGSGTNDLNAVGSLETVSLKDLENKANILKAQMSRLQATLAQLEQSGVKMAELERRKKVHEAALSRYEGSLEEAKFDTDLGPGKVSGINPVQEPTPAAREASKLRKMMAMAVGGAFGAAVGLALLIEFLLDTSIKRPVELESKLKWRSSFTMPRVSRGDWRRATRRNRRSMARAAKTDNGEGNIGYNEVTWRNGKDKLPPWSDQHPLRPEFEALRDQLIAEFELGNVTHKPKLVAVTSCSHGSGVSTLATGLAASLSETGGGNVLLVDMNQKEGAAHTLYKGKPGAVGLPDALEQGKRDAALIHQNLYAVSATQVAHNGDDELPRVLPRRFSHLMPKIKASDYDFIIFDMPPVDQVSLTSRLAGFMDKVLLVVESEKTTQVRAQRAAKMLNECKANVSPVLNKYHRYVPELLDEEA